MRAASICLHRPLTVITSYSIHYTKLYENSIFSLAKALEKTQKLLNALENVIIPQYKEKIRFILATLEEREREDFAKLKKVKAKMESGS